MSNLEVVVQQGTCDVCNKDHDKLVKIGRFARKLFICNSCLFNFIVLLNPEEGVSTKPTIFPTSYWVSELKKAVNDIKKVYEESLDKFTNEQSAELAKLQQEFYSIKGEQNGQLPSRLQ